MPIGIRFTPLTLILILTPTRHIYVGDEGTSELFFWNFWEDPQYFSLDYLL